MRVIQNFGLAPEVQIIIGGCPKQTACNGHGLERQTALRRYDPNQVIPPPGDTGLGATTAGNENDVVNGVKHYRQMAANISREQNDGL